MTRVLAVDIGGTKLAAGVVRDDGALLTRRDAPTLATTDAEELFGALGAVIDDLGPDRLGAVAVGVGCGGPMTRDGEAVSPLNIPAWRGFPLRARLAQRCGLPVFVDNDGARCPPLRC